jgi:hypothetical protein
MTVEAPIAGTTNSVNTINPTVQVQGAYTGSAVSTAKMPFSGKLFLRDAIERGSTTTLVRWASATLRARRKGKVRLHAAPCFPI